MSLLRATRALRIAERQPSVGGASDVGVVASSSLNLRIGCAILMMALASALAACGGGGSTASSAPATSNAFVDSRPVSLSDVEIAELLYSDAHRTPQGFFSDTAPTMPGYVATSHIKNIDITGAAAATQFELCTDDWAKALDWSDQATSLANSVLTDTMSTASYFEFDRTRSGNPVGYLRARVYRCSYLDRGDVDLQAGNGVAGQLNVRPITGDALQQLAEYLWTFTSYNNYGNVVLKSSGTAAGATLQHTLTIATLTPNSISGCDHVNVIGWTHSVDTQTGGLNLTTQPLWDFGAKRVAGIVELCNPF